MVFPVIHSAASDARKHTTWATSAGMPTRLIDATAAASCCMNRVSRRIQDMAKQQAYIVDHLLGVVGTVRDVLARHSLEHVGLDGARRNSVDRDPLVATVDSLNAHPLVSHTTDPVERSST